MVVIPEIVVDIGRTSDWPMLRPLPLLRCYQEGRGPEWGYFACPTSQGSIAGRAPTKEAAPARAVRFLVEHGELDGLFEALLGYLGAAASSEPGGARRAASRSPT
jgi:hypothetical protein